MRIKRALLLALVVAAVAVGAWFASDDATRAAIGIGSKPAQTAAKAKPICATPGNSSVAPPIDCIPAGIPPDPGEAGKLTIDGICGGVACDPEKNPAVLRDDVARWIALEWGHSPIAVKGLEIIAQQQLRAIHYGDNLGKAKTLELFGAESMRQSACAADLETLEMQQGGAYSRLTEQVKNTDARKLQSHNFSYMFANTVRPAFAGTASEACGFDVDELARAEGKETIAQMLAAEVAERAKQEAGK